MGRVFVLGAGASRALNSGAPLMGQLLEQALEFSLDLREGTASAPIARDVKGFLAEVYGMRYDVFPPDVVPPFEDVLSLVDYCIENNIPLSRQYSVDYLRQLRKNLIYIMGRVLQVKLARSTNTCLIESFLSKLSENDSIISMNYDLIIDNGVLDRHDMVDYHITTKINQELANNGNTRKTSIYKLHGSLNWLYCPVCRVLRSYDGRKQALAALIRNIPCDDCHTPLEPILITPSFLKNYNNSFIVEVWRKAQERLQRADEVFFVGYSMPDADIELRMFFTRALYANKLIHDGRRCRITVIDKSESDKSAVRVRYEKIFGEVEYYKDGFDRYIVDVLAPNASLDNSSSKVMFQGKPVTRQAVLCALLEFGAKHPDPNAYENWLHKDSYRYAIDHEGKLYPPKHILSLVTGIPTTEFSGGDQTNRVFRKLGFTVIHK